MPGSIKLWDPVVRIFHWSLAFSFFANAFFTDASEDWHEWIGYYALVWVLVRFAWGFIAKGAASWADCWPTPGRLKAHALALVVGKPFHRLGHSPIGALVMVCMMLSMLVLGITGYMLTEIDFFWGEEWLEELHEIIADALMVLVAVHILAAIIESIRLRENLVLSMITGRRKPLEVEP